MGQPDLGLDKLFTAPDFIRPEIDFRKVLPAIFHAQGARQATLFAAQATPNIDTPTLRWLSQGALVGGNAKVISELVIEPNEDPLHLSAEQQESVLRDVLALSGPEINTWLDDPQNAQNLIHAYRDIYGHSEWKEGLKIRDIHMHFYEKAKLIKELELQAEYTEAQLCEVIESLGLPVSQAKLIRAAYFHGTSVSDSMVLPKMRLDPTVALIIGLDLQASYGYSEYDQLFSSLRAEYQEPVMALYEEYYPTHELLERFQTELKPEPGRTPILIVSTMQHPEFGEIITGFCWAVFFHGTEVIPRLVERIVGANYTQTTELQAAASLERESLLKGMTEHEQTLVEPGLQLPRCYIDEIAILPSLQRKGVFGPVFGKLVEAIGIEGARLVDQAEPEIPGAVYCFRTLRDGKMNKIMTRVFDEALHQVHTSAAEDGDPVMVYKDLFVIAQVMQAIALDPSLVYVMFKPPDDPAESVES